MHRGWWRLFSNFLHLHVKEHSWIPCHVAVGLEASTIPTQALNVELLKWTFQSVNFRASLKCFSGKCSLKKSWKGSVSVCLFCLSCWSVDYPSSKHMSKWLQSGVHYSEGDHLWQPGAEWRCGYFFSMLQWRIPFCCQQCNTWFVLWPPHLLICTRVYSSYMKHPQCTHTHFPITTTHPRLHL